MTKIPEISSYGNYSSDNYGVNSLMVNLGKIILFYSYKTIVAFRTCESGLVVSENLWQSTTGKHLNWLDGGNKKERLSRADFEIALENALIKHIV